MLARCHNPKHVTWHRYGGRGITVCAEWRVSYVSFAAAVGQRPSKDHQLDRINNDSNYQPGNVRWATRKENARNRSNNRMITVGDETLCLSEWVERTGVPYDTLTSRLGTLGWSADEALTTPVGGRRRRLRQRQSPQLSLFAA